MATIDREGRFTAQILECSIYKPESSESVGWNFHAALMHEATAEGWNALDPMPDVYGTVWLVKKDGTVNENGVKQMKDALGWDGDWGKLEGDHVWPNFQCDVAADTYNGKTKMKATWLHSYEADPSARSGMKAMEPNERKSLASKYQAATRAICGVKSTGAPAPKGSPPSPTKKSAEAVAASTEDNPPF